MEDLKLGTIEVGGKVNVQDVSFHCLEIGGKRVYECQMILDINGLQIGLVFRRFNNKK